MQGQVGAYFVIVFHIQWHLEQLDILWFSVRARVWHLTRQVKRWEETEGNCLSSSSSSLCAIRSQQVGCHGSPSFSILCHSDAVIIWYFCPFLDVIRPHCSGSPPSSSAIYPSFHQQSLYPISSYYMSKVLTFPFFWIIFDNDLLVFLLCTTSPLVLCSFHDIFNILLHSHISKASNLSDVTLACLFIMAV